jgi:2-keto-4-pentenoate hydratase/2-oxohepta-3-ene-1,7-dioic acid hydratase in catechol pathway
LRLVSVRGEHAPVLGVQAGDRWLPASDLLAGGPSTMDELVRGGTEVLAALGAADDPARIAADGRPIEEAALLAPVGHPGKVVAIGRNYREHADEEGVDAPAAPLVFAKWPSAIVGPGADIRWDPEYATQVDYEAELAVVIGREARRVSVADALDHVLGYTCLNDVSARDLQFGDGQWTRGKSLDTFCPMGPSLVTADELKDPQALAIECRVNGEVLQRSSTAAMFFGVADIVSYCSMAFTIQPGDVIATGTPGGVGIFRDPPILLTDGDVVEVTIERIGTLRNTCRHERVAGSVPARAGTAT